MSKAMKMTPFLIKLLKEKQVKTNEYWASSTSNFKTYEEALDKANTMLDSEIHEGYELIIN